MAFVLSLAFAACAMSRAFDEPIHLPSSTTARNAVPSLTVTVTTTAILVDGDAVAPIAAGKVVPKFKRDGANGYYITRLVETLERRVPPDRHAAIRAGKPNDNHVNLSFDRTVPYRLFTEVVYSCGQAGYAKYDLIVKQTTDGSLAAINFVVPDFERPPAATVWVTRNALKVGIDDEWSELPRLSDGRYDYESLRTRLRALQASGGDAANERATLIANPSIPYEVIVATMDTMRVNADGTPLFPVIQFAAAK